MIERRRANRIMDRLKVLRAVGIVLAEEAGPVGFEE